MKIQRCVFLFIAVALLGSCASAVKQHSNTGFKYSGETIDRVDLKLSPAMEQKLAIDSNGFSKGAMRSALVRELTQCALMRSGARHALQVNVNDVRVRSTANAMLWGFMAGNDHIRGTVRLLDETGNPVNQFDVSAAYALGGLVGGVDSIRLNWLYEEFAEQTVAGLGLTKEGDSCINRSSSSSLANRPTQASLPQMEPHFGTQAYSDCMAEANAGKLTQADCERRKADNVFDNFLRDQHGVSP